MKKLLVISILISLFLGSCVTTKSVMYDETTYYPPTEIIHIYSDVSEIPYESRAIGILIASSGEITSEEKHLAALVKKAKEKGANAIILSSLNDKKTHISIWSGVTTEAKSGAQMYRFELDDQGEYITKN